MGLVGLATLIPPKTTIILVVLRGVLREAIMAIGGFKRNPPKTQLTPFLKGLFKKTPRKKRETFSEKRRFLKTRKTRNNARKRN